MVAVAVVALAACGDDDEATTTASTPASCPDFTIGEVHNAPANCLPSMLDRVMASEGAEYDEDAAPGWAQSACIRIDTAASPSEGVLSISADWALTDADVPVASESDRPVLLAAAVAVYCPELYDAAFGTG